MKFSYAHFPVGTVFEINDQLPWIKEKVFTVKEIAEPNPGNVVIVTKELQGFDSHDNYVTNYVFDIRYVKCIIKRGDGPLKFNVRAADLIYRSGYQDIRKIILHHTPKDGYGDYEKFFEAMFNNNLIDEYYCRKVKMARIKKFIKQRLNTFLLKKKLLIAEYEKSLEEEYRNSLDDTDEEYWDSVDRYASDEEKVTVTEEALFEGSTMGSYGYERLKKSYKGILTKDEVNAKLSNGGKSVMLMSSLDHRLVFFTDIYGLGYKVFKELGLDFVSSSMSIPMLVNPREGLEDGLVHDADTLLYIFHHDDRLIESMEELLAWIGLYSVEKIKNKGSFYNDLDNL